MTLPNDLPDDIQGMGPEALAETGISLFKFCREQEQSLDKDDKKKLESTFEEMLTKINEDMLAANQAMRAKGKDFKDRVKDTSYLIKAQGEVARALSLLRGKSDSKDNMDAFRNFSKSCKTGLEGL